MNGEGLFYDEAKFQAMGNGMHAVCVGVGSRGGMVGVRPYLYLAGHKLKSMLQN